MIKSAQEFIEQMRRDIQRWETDLSSVEKDGANGTAKKIRAWIDEGKRLIEGLGHHHA